MAGTGIHKESSTEVGVEYNAQPRPCDQECGHNSP